VVGLPEIEQSPEEEAQSYRFYDDFKKSKRFVELLGFVCKVKIMNHSLHEDSKQRLLEKLDVVRKITCEDENYWNDYRKKISDPIIIFQSFWVSFCQLPIGCRSGKVIKLSDTVKFLKFPIYFLFKICSDSLNSFV
jgi:hypothetical protein